MVNGIFTITSEGKTGHYYTENFAELPQVLPLLWSVHTARDRVPELRASNATQLLSYSKGMLPVCTTPSRRLFQPLEQARFEQLREDLLDGDTDLCHYTLDYDGNRFALTSWGEEGVGAFSAPMDQVICACVGARKLSPSGKPYLDQRLLSRALQDIATVESASKTQELTEPDEPEMSM